MKNIYYTPAEALVRYYPDMDEYLLNNPKPYSDDFARWVFTIDGIEFVYLGNFIDAVRQMALNAYDDGAETVKLMNKIPWDIE